MNWRVTGVSQEAESIPLLEAPNGPRVTMLGKKRIAGADRAVSRIKEVIRRKIISTLINN